MCCSPPEACGVVLFPPPVPRASGRFPRPRRPALPPAAEGAGPFRCKHWFENCRDPARPNGFARWSTAASSRTAVLSRATWSAQMRIASPPPDRGQLALPGSATPNLMVIHRQASPLEQRKTRSSPRSGRTSHFLRDHKERSGQRLPPRPGSDVQPARQTVLAGFDGGPQGPPSRAELRSAEDLPQSRNDFPYSICASPESPLGKREDYRASIKLANAFLLCCSISGKSRGRGLSAWQSVEFRFPEQYWGRPPAS